MIIFQRIAERIRNTFTRPWSRLRSNSRVIIPDITKSDVLDKRLPEFEDQGDATGVLDAEKAIIKAEHDKEKRLMDQLVQIRLLLHREILLLGYAARAVQSDTRLQGGQSKSISDMLQTVRSQMTLFLDTLLKTEVGFESMNMTFDKLVDQSSQARDLYYACKQVRYPAKQTINDEKTLLKKRNDAFDVHKLGQDMAAEIILLQRISKMDILLLQEEQNHLDQEKNHVQELITKRKFPPYLVQEYLAQYESMLATMKKFVNDEIAKDRREMSDAEHAL